MTDIIQILPDSIANQIAAGEVIQRPASAVKELMENAVDSGASIINVIIKDAGRTLIQVIDDGCGMSETDARMSFERHATSKIRSIDDLFEIRTKGFRGEALASIASIAQVELKSKRVEDDLGTCIKIDGSNFVSQESCNINSGTSIHIKNLFFNVPARRNFLKSNPAEMKHIIDEFQRVAMAHPEISFTLSHNENEIYHLKKTQLRQRIVELLGKKNYNERLVPVEEKTDIVNINGYIGKPEFARKTRGDQFFFVNNRFIKSPYLNHAVSAAYTELTTKDQFPLYVLFIDVAPKSIDINVHPTKTEIKFHDEKVIYAFIRSAVKHGLGKYNVTPSLDFEQERSIQHLLSGKKDIQSIRQPGVTFNPSYNPFEKNNKNTDQNWEKLYDIPTDNADTSSVISSVKPQLDFSFLKKNSLDINQEPISDEVPNHKTFQLQKKYILTQIKSGLMIIDQQAAHERILYEKFLSYLKKNEGVSQQALFPQSIELKPGDFELLKEALPELNTLGFDIEEFGNNTIIVNGLPPELSSGNSSVIIEGLLEQYQQNLTILKLEKHESIARAMAKQTAVKHGKVLDNEEMDTIIHNLFSCKQPNSSPEGAATVVKLTMDELENKFGK